MKLKLLGLVVVLAVGIGIGTIFYSPSKTVQLGDISAVTTPTTTAPVVENTLTATTTATTTAVATTTPVAKIKEATTTKKTTNVAIVSTTTAPLPPTPAPVPTPAVTPTPTTDNALPPEIAIDPETLVGILCYYDPTVRDPQTGDIIPVDWQWEVRGSGVIYDSKGDVLTNRHIIQQPEDFINITDKDGNVIPVAIDYVLNHCEVGQLPAGTHLPTPDEIKTLNPYVQIPVLGYTAEPFYVSPTSGLTNDEIENADFALLRITGVSSSGPTFGVTSVPSSFPFTKLLPTQPYAMTNDQVVTYGFPGNVSQGQGNFFGTLTMTGSVGRVTSIDFGDHYYADTPLTIHTNMEIAHGRSGSPLFWRGYVIGLVFRFYGDSIFDSGSVASDAILKAMR